MNQKLILAACLSAGLAACAPNPETSLNQTCQSVLSDPATLRDLADSGMSSETFCACASRQILAMPESSRDSTIAAFEAIETAMAESGGSAERAFESIRDASRADDATPAQIKIYRDLDALGDMLDDLVDTMEESGGSCPA